MKDEEITAWVTKYALTKGILVVRGVVKHTICSTMLSYGDPRHQSAHGLDWHRTPEAALLRAESMRKARIASLRASISKIEKMRFTAPAAEEIA